MKVTTTTCTLTHFPLMIQLKKIIPYNTKIKCNQNVCDKKKNVLYTYMNTLLILLRQRLLCLQSSAVVDRD